MEVKKKFGAIFFPESPEKRIEGVWLHISETSIFVEAPFDYFSNHNWPIILGEFNGMDNLTFVNCYTGGGSKGFGGSYRRIIISNIICGVHILKTKDLAFKEFTLSSPALNTWINELVGINDLGNGKYEVPKSQCIVRSKINELAICLYRNYYSDYNFKHLKIDKNYVAVLESKNPIAFNILSQKITLLKKLILFLTNKNPEFGKNYLFIEPNQESGGYELISIKHQLKEDMFSQNFQISYSEINDSLENIIKHWFKQDKLHAIIDLVLEKCYNTEMSTPGFFLNICVGLEGFHRRYSPKIKISATENKKAIIDLIKQDQELLIWFKNKSKEWENPSLRDRLIEFKPTLELIIINIFDIDDFITKVVQTRNEMAHDGVYNKRFTTNIELFIATKAIEFTIRIEILKLLKIGNEKLISKYISKAAQNLEVLVRINRYEPIIKSR